ncbi:MAG TPA: putative metal-dependent hydrolase [Planctomycetota bacterium]|nr:putative metal-dependent hydrolase [Planctomycetota bacterium]
MSHAASPQPTPHTQPTGAAPHAASPAPHATTPVAQATAHASSPTAPAGPVSHAASPAAPATRREPPRFAGSDADRIAAIAQFPRQARQAIDGLSAAQLDTPYRPGGWTIAQVIHHIADSHVVAFTRMKFILAEEHPTVRPFDENVWAQQADAAVAPVDDSLLLLDGLHARMAKLLAAQPAAAFARSALHPERGEVTLSDLLDTYAWHGPHHLEAIAKLRKDRGW